MRSTVGATLSAVACAVALSTGCTDDIGGPPGPGPDDVANLTVRLTDAPGDIQSAVVTITEINLQGGSNGPVVVSDDPITLDLVELADTAATIVNAAEVPADTYQELRFVISGGFLVVEDEGGTRVFASSPTVDGLPAGTVPDGILVMPSLGQSGLKVSFDAPLVITGSTDLLLDFDVSQSFGKEAGNSGRWVMRPVVRGGQTTEAGRITVSAALADTVTLPTLNGSAVTLADFQAEVGGETKSLVDDGAGNFGASFGTLLPGTYDVRLVPPEGVVVTTDLTMPVQVDLAAGGTETVAFIITGVQATDTTSSSSITVSAALADTVTLPTLNGTLVTLADFQAQVGAVMQPLVDDGAGNFQVSFSALPSGTHDVRLVPPAGVVFTTDLTMPVMVTLAPGDTATVAFIITSAAASGS